MCRMSHVHVTYHVSCVICHMSHVTYHVSHVTFFILQDKMVKLVSERSVNNKAPLSRFYQTLDIVICTKLIGKEDLVPEAPPKKKCHTCF